MNYKYFFIDVTGVETFVTRVKIVLMVLKVLCSTVSKSVTSMNLKIE